MSIQQGPYIQNIRNAARLTVVVLAIASLAGCAGSPARALLDGKTASQVTMEKISANFGSWVGGSSDKLIMAYGAPSASVHLPNGSSALRWDNVECTPSFIVDKNNTVIGWSQASCKAKSWKEILTGPGTQWCGMAACPTR